MSPRIGFSTKSSNSISLRQSNLLITSGFENGMASTKCLGSNHNNAGQGHNSPEKGV